MKPEDASEVNSDLFRQVASAATHNEAGVSTSLAVLSIPSNSLAFTGDFVEIEAWLTLATVEAASSKVVLSANDLGGGAQDVYDSGSIATTSGLAFLKGKIVRVGESLECYFSLTMNEGSPAFKSTTLTRDFTQDWVISLLATGTLDSAIEFNRMDAFFRGYAR